ncbi:aldo/keto reductase [Fodinicola acaciae]|uniref:aldo/keto reductase n=1 Tax=Fodinicola acaciae TaxID=2681555 RepID=UPI0013D42904|nr:aldo/keto reductase [Fodinicola acaciae]
MRFRQLGHSGLSVSEISYGNWLTHGLPEFKACVRAALRAGVNTFHTAPMLGDGHADEMLADALSSAAREDLVLCTGAYWPETLGPNRAGLGRKHLVGSLDGSLRRLGTDYVDVFQLLRYDYKTPLEETFLALSDLVQQGKILYVGTSEWNAEQLQAAAHLAAALRVPLVSNQPHYSMVWRVPESQVFPLCQRLGIGQLACAPLIQGVATGKYAGGERPAGSRAANPATSAAVAPLLFPDLLDRIGLLAGVAQAAGLTPAQLAIAWVLQNETVASAVIGASTPEQIEENAAASGVELSLDVLTQIDELLGRVVQTDPRMTFSPPQHAF